MLVNSERNCMPIEKSQAAGKSEDAGGSSTAEARTDTRIAVYDMAYILATTTPAPAMMQDQILQRMLQDTMDVHQEHAPIGTAAGDSTRGHSPRRAAFSVERSESAHGLYQVNAGGSGSFELLTVRASTASSTMAGALRTSMLSRGSHLASGEGLHRNMSAGAPSEAGTRASAAVSFTALVKPHDDDSGAVGRVLSRVGPQGGSWRRREKRIQLAMNELSARLELDTGTVV